MQKNKEDVYTFKMHLIDIRSENDNGIYILECIK